MATKKKAVEKPAAENSPEAAAAERDAGVRFKDLLDRVVARSGAKKKDVKDTLEASLIELGLALGAGEELNLAGLGRLKVVKTVEKNGNKMLTIKLKQVPDKKGEKSAVGGLAEEGEAG